MTAKPNAELSDAPKRPARLSIVATLYMSEEYVEEFCRRAASVARKLVGEEFEIVLVNDGSPDGSLDRAVALTTGPDRVSVIDLSRNFGHHKAMMTGLAHATGDLVFLIDSDLEEEPHWLESFFHQLERTGCDVVYGVQQARKGGVFERWTGQWFYTIFRMATGMALPQNVVTARLMTKRYVGALLQHEEREIFIAGLWHITGYDQRPQLVSKNSKNTTTYTLRRKISLLVNSITSFSNAPLVAIFYVGILISTVTSIYILYLIINFLFINMPLSGWTSTMASIWFLGGLIISFIGVVGIYLSKIYSETKHRPYTIVREVFSHRDPN